MERRYRILLSLVLIASIFVFSGCRRPRHAVPEELLAKAKVPGIPDARSYTHIPNTLTEKSLVDSLKQESPNVYTLEGDSVKVYPMLAISGGAANGAYGAGFLKGWSDNGTRPKFKVVTGISTGALIAPFAFLGKDYDDELKECYTTISTKDVIRAKRLLLNMFFGDSIVSSEPLAKYIERIVDKKMLEDIAAEHRRGRRLFVGTTNLDAQRLVLWDMGAIASTGTQQALELFRKVVLASSSIPAAFPPVFFEVEVDGKIYDELHVDGGTVAQVFYLQGLVKHMWTMVESAGIDPKKIKVRLYLLRNGFVTANWQEVPDTLYEINKRAIDTSSSAQAVGDIYRIYAFVNKRGGDFNLAYIPEDFESNPKELFDNHDMQRLFARGYEDALEGYKWHKAPPGLEPEVK